ncbi:phospholipase D family protein [Actinomarinicola tropica]|uniref:PLD phosphodiesterase domain-containing protein n=1 Tax=Actinomarinicola tropica TaxID=2789776 RepID=A0A5Q2RKH5_9ACTN|nr:phospholipase D family protein [Actinomarinicola tropica]QGG94360.1 hypothetical protein GH723_04160 [Actinomarinicola tropica]
MLPPDRREVLLDMLRPPVGYRLDAAVGTTFTLSLDAALVVPLAFASFRLSGTSDPIAVMEAVRSAADRVDVFCQAGQVTVPMQASGLFAFLEPMVHEVRRPRPGHLFHPKVWFLRYTADGETPWLRLLCMTRNLTDDASWDLAVRLDADEGAQSYSDNQPLARFIEALPGMATGPLPAERAARIRRLVTAAHRAEWEYPDDVNEIAFWPLGIGASESPRFDGYRHLVVAPFLNDGGLARLIPSPSTDSTVVSRVEDLERLSPATLETLGSTKIMNSAADLDDPEAEELRDRDRLAGLHAKMVVVERSQRAHVFIGSANATDAAYGGNVEMMVELVGGASKLGVERLLGTTDGFGTLLEPYSPLGDAPDDPTEEALRLLRELLRTAAEANFVATVVRDGESYRERITADRLAVPSGVRLTAELITLPGTAAQIDDRRPLDSTLGPLALDQVTPFLVLRASTNGPGGEQLHQATVVRCHLVDDPDGRLDEILARQVDTPEKFLRFLLLLLGIADPSVLMADTGGSAGGSWSIAGTSNGVFELLARAASDRPEALDDLDRLVGRLQATTTGATVLPDGFDAVWQVISAARAELAKLHRTATP